jgi:hypothetical protein
MLRATTALSRRRTPWRELLHPLAPSARRRQWLKRDATEANEAVLREPYYKLKQVVAGDVAARDGLVFPVAVGPMPEDSTVPAPVHGLRALYPETWETVPTHQPSKR